MVWHDELRVPLIVVEGEGRHLGGVRVVLELGDRRVVDERRQQEDEEDHPHRDRHPQHRYLVGEERVEGQPKAHPHLLVRIRRHQRGHVPVVVGARRRRRRRDGHLCRCELDRRCRRDGGAAAGAAAGGGARGGGGAVISSPLLLLLARDLGGVGVLRDLDEHFLQRGDRQAVRRHAELLRRRVERGEEPRKLRRRFLRQRDRQLLRIRERLDRRAGDVALHELEQRVVAAAGALRAAERQVEAVPGLALERHRRADALEAPLVEDRDAVAERVGLVEEVGGEHERAPLLRVRHRIPHLPPRRRVHPRRRLVEQHKLRVADQRARERELSLLAAAQRVAPCVLLLVAEADVLEHLLDGARPEVRFGHPLARADELDRLGARERDEEEVVLRADARDGADGVHPALAHLVAVDRRVALRLREEAGEDRDHRRLPRAVLPEQARDLPLEHPERHAGERDHRLALRRERPPEVVDAHHLGARRRRLVGLLAAAAEERRGHRLVVLRHRDATRRLPRARGGEPHVQQPVEQKEAPAAEERRARLGALGELRPAEALAVDLLVVEGDEGLHRRDVPDEAARGARGRGRAGEVEAGVRADAEHGDEEHQALRPLLRLLGIVGVGLCRRDDEKGPREHRHTGE